jgi:hypothetical protein
MSFCLLFQGGIGNVYPQGGYKTQTVTQIGNLLAVFRRGQISLRATRLYFAALAAVSAREVAGRCRSSKGRKQVGRSYQIAELARISGVPVVAVRKGLRSLERAGLLLYSESNITVTESALPGSDEIITELAGGRSAMRPVPLPRPVLRYLARCPRTATIKTMLGYCVRGLSLSRSGEVRGRGTAKASWIARVCGTSLRAVRVARAELIACRFIGRDEGSKQWKLNRDGAYFSINFDFGCANVDRPEFGAVLERQAPRVRSASRIAPPVGENCMRSALPYENKKTPIGLKDRKTRGSEPTGVEGRGAQIPNLNDLHPDDLRRVSRLKLVYRQAVAAGWLPDCEASFQNFVAAALRANQAQGDAVRIFVSIVRRKLWHHITLEQEERARQAIRRDRERECGRDGDANPGRCVTPRSVSNLIAQLTSQLPAGLLMPR